MTEKEFLLKFVEMHEDLSKSAGEDVNKHMAIKRAKLKKIHKLCKQFELVYSSADFLGELFNRGEYGNIEFVANALRVVVSE